MERYRGIEDVPSTRARRMHRYWLDKKGDRVMPARSDIEPGEIKDLLPHVIAPASVAGAVADIISSGDAERDLLET